MIRRRKKAIISYFLTIIYVFVIIFIIITGKEKTKITTSNVNNVKSIQSSRIENDFDNTFNTSYKLNKIVTNVNDIKKYGKDYKIEFTGTLTGYGPDCPGCGGKVGCYPNPDVRNGNMGMVNPFFLYKK